MADAQEQKPSLAFTFQKKKLVQKVAVNVVEQKDIGQLISGIEGAKIQVVGGDTDAELKTYVIPKIENTYKSGVGPKKFTPSYKPPSSDANVDNSEDRFVQAASTVPVITEYGLQLREDRPGNRAAGDAGPSNGVGHGNRGGGGSTTAAALEARAFREAVEQLPEAIDVEAYEAMPVEEFGKAMLRGMGWQEGMGVGRNRRQVDAIEYVRRPERLGLGAQPLALGADKTKPVKMGDKPQRQDLVLAPDADGRQRNVRKLDEQLVARSTVLPGPQPGKEMRITLGPHAGLACTALEVLPTKGDAKQHERWLVRLAASQEMVVVQVSELGEKWERAKAVDKSEKDAGGGDDGGDGGGGGGGQPESSRGAGGGRDREDRRSDRDHDRSHDRQYDRDKDSGRQRGREREEWGWADDGGGGKRKSREEDDERRPVDDQDGGRGGSKRSRVSEPYQSKGGSGGMRGDDRQYDSRYDNDNDDAKKDSRDHHKHGKKEKHKNDKRDKKDKKKKKEKKEHEKDLNRNRDHRSGGGWSDRDRARERDASYSRSEEGDDSEEMVEEEKAVEKGTAAGGRPTWLFPAIKVRIVDKSVRGGKLYLKKGTVVDVHPGGTADVAVDDTGDVLRLPESSLETVVPRHEGAAVLVVAGPHRGARGRLLQASTATGAAAVQLAADFSIVRLMLDDVAGFVGELDEE